MEKILQNIDIQFMWSMLAVDINTEDQSDELLSSVVSLWIKIRAHSQASAVMEEYKKSTSINTKGAKGIRKQLKFTGE